MIAAAQLARAGADLWEKCPRAWRPIETGELYPC
jgi:hypothetical protein